ncbi:winged helix-turn-helix transcriptional regulator [Lactiplantibacillus paraplantarum]|uniref:Winged helix-turn-helix transcriptional regulator n=1 Tax=Lactiplantibacillus paraplantarum TaxID=60520 RepID=A0A4Q9Y394_9LACO|nr:winged helix-turn-helix transcriptional regulator [Lactiplantibacillus paraplantarum]
MRPFFNQDKRDVQILNYLDCHPICTYTELADQIELNRATVTTSVKRLEIALNAQHLNGLTLTTSSQGIEFHRDIHINLATLLPILLDQRIAVIFESLIYERYSTITALAQRLYTSESTTRRLIAKMNQTLKQYKVHINTNGLSLVGREPDIRYTAFQYYWNTYGSVTWPFRYSEQELLTQSQKFQISNYNQLKFAFWLALCRLRQNNQHLLRSEDLYQRVPDPEKAFIRLIQLLDFSNFDFLKNLNLDEIFQFKLPSWGPDIWPELLENKATHNLLKLSKWYTTIFSTNDLLYDRNYQLEHYLNTMQFTKITQLKKQCHGYRLLMLKVYEALNYIGVFTLQTTVKIALISDSDEHSHALISQQLKTHFEQWHVVITNQYDQADLILTNLTVQHAKVPVIYVNMPLNSIEIDTIGLWLYNNLNRE